MLAGVDENIPAALQRFMAERSGARATREISGASHALSVSRPGEVTDMIMAAMADVSAVAV